MARKDKTEITIDDLTVRQEAVLRACIDVQAKNDYIPLDTISKLRDTFCKLDFDVNEPLYMDSNVFNSTLNSLLNKKYLVLYSGLGVTQTRKGVVYVEQQQKNYVENYDFDIISLLDSVAKKVQYVAKKSIRKK